MAPDERKPELVRWPKQICDSQQKTLAVYSVGAEVKPLFIDAGFDDDYLSQARRQLVASKAFWRAVQCTIAMHGRLKPTANARTLQAAQYHSCFAM
jgi:hypothetical protein